MVETEKTSEEAFTVELSESLLTLKAPSIAWVDKEVTCTGTTAQPNMEVWLEDEKLLDEPIPGTRTYSDSEGKYSIPVTFTEFGVVKIHAETDSGFNQKSQTRTVIVLDMLTVGLIVGVLLFLWYMLKKK